MKNNIVIDLRLYNKFTGIGLVSKKIYQFLDKDKFNVIAISGEEQPDFIDPSILVYKLNSVFGILNNIKLYFFLLKIKPKYVIFPHYFVNTLIPKSIKTIAFVHDIMAISHKHQFWKSLPNFKALILKIYLKAVLKKTDIITPSNTVKNELLSYLNFNSIVIPNGSDYNIKNIQKQNIFLYIGNNRKHKNLPFLLNVFSKLENRLIVVNSEVKSTNDNIIIKSKINEDELKNIYSTSIALIIPSFCEGFGIPIVDAIKLKSKVFASKIDVFKEFYGLNITYFNPYNPDELKELISFNTKSSYINTFSNNADNLDIFNWNELKYYFKNLA